MLHLGGSFSNIILTTSTFGNFNLDDNLIIGTC